MWGSGVAAQIVDRNGTIAPGTKQRRLYLNCGIPSSLLTIAALRD